MHMIWEKLRHAFIVKANWKRCVFIYIGMVCIGFLALLLTMCLPQSTIRARIESYAYKMPEEALVYYYGDRMSNAIAVSADAVLLSFIYNQSEETPLYSATVFRQCIPEKESFSQRDTLIAAIREESSQWYEYSAIWFGMMVPLKVALCTLEYTSVMKLFEILCVILAFLTVAIVIRRVGWKEGITYAIALFSVNYFILVKNLFQGASVFVIMFLTVAVLLCRKERRWTEFEVMLLIGMITVYFDWFSVPLISWGGVLFLFLKQAEREGKRGMQEFNMAFNASVGWCIGYFMMVVTKAVVTLPVLGRGAVDFIMSRATMEMKEIPFGQFAKGVWALIKELQPLAVFSSTYVKVGFVTILLISFLATCVVAHKRKCVPISLLIGVAPLAWYYVFKSHIHHVHIDYRTLFLTVLVALDMVLECVRIVLAERRTK